MHVKRLRNKFARRKITVFRNERGVPHIEASAWPDAFYGLGYMHGLDRTTQMTFAQAVGYGRGSELLSDRPAIFSRDRLMRQLGVAHNLEKEIDAFSDASYAVVVSYCEGVNDGFRESGRTLPMHFVGHGPGRWDAAAVILMGRLLNFIGLAMGQHRGERMVLDLIRSGVHPERMRELYSPFLDEVDFDLLQHVKSPNRLSNQILTGMEQLPHLVASNAWAIAPHRSQSGAALLASDPHLEINHLPAIWYESTLKVGDDYLMGASLPGTPMFAVGRNRQLAWGVTYSMADCCDFFIEECRVRDGVCQYRRGSDWLDFEVRRETIYRKRKRPKVLNFYSNPQGVLEGDPLKDGDGYYLLSAWTATEEGESGKAADLWISLNACKHTNAAMDVVRQCPQPPLCWVFADREGHIGRQVSGLFPKRKSPTHGLAPLPAWDTDNHWQGYLSPEELPGVYDPPEGFVCSANEDINPPGGPVLVTLPAADYRYRRLSEELAQLSAATVADCQRLQYDAHSLQAREICDLILPHMPETELKRSLQQWDYHYHAESREATLFTRLYTCVLLEVFGQPTELGGMGRERLLYLTTQKGFNLAMVNYLDRVLRNEDSLWWNGRPRGDLLASAMRIAQAQEAPPWGQVNTLTFRNTFINGFLGRVLRLDYGPVPVRGCHATPFQGQLVHNGKTPTSMAPSYHFVTDLGTNEAWTNLPGGVSEKAFSRWYRSDLKHWVEGKYKRLSATAFRTSAGRP